MFSVQRHTVYTNRYTVLGIFVWILILHRTAYPL